MAIHKASAQRAGVALSTVVERLDEVRMNGTVRQLHVDAIEAAMRALNAIYDGDVDQAVIDLLVLATGMNESAAIFLNRKAVRQIRQEGAK